MEISWKLYDGIFFNYMLGNSGGCRRLFDYGIMLWHQTKVKAMTPGADLSRTIEAKL